MEELNLTRKGMNIVMSLKKIKSTLDKNQQKEILHKLNKKKKFEPKEGRATNAHLLTIPQLNELKRNLLDTIDFIKQNVDKYSDRGVEALTISEALLKEVNEELGERKCLKS